MTFSLRPATAADFPLHVRLMPELEVDDPPPVLERWLAEQAPGTWVAERAGVPVGTIWFQKLEGSGYVRQVIVDPRARRSGAGRAMMLHVREHLFAAGCSTWRLNVKPTNVAAVRLYESLGMRREYSSASYWVDWGTLERLERSALSASLVPPEHDAEVEAAFSLPAGQLAQARTTGKVLLLVRDGNEVVGFANFAPSFPGAFPFRVKRPAAARALLEMMRAHAPAGAPRVGVVIEDDPTLQAQLAAAGAPLRMSFDHYAGPLESR